MSEGRKICSSAGRQARKLLMDSRGKKRQIPAKRLGSFTRPFRPGAAFESKSSSPWLGNYRSSGVI